MEPLFLFCVLAGCCCCASRDFTEVFALQKSTVALPCPVKSGDVTWKHLTGGPETTTLVTIHSGQEIISNKEKYGSLADNSLVIKNVEPSDSRMYFCNDSQVYLQVTADPNMVPRNAGLDLGLEPGQKGGGTRDEAGPENPASSDLWKVPVGVLVGAALALAAVFTLRFCSERNSNVDKTPEVIYEEIEGLGEHWRSESHMESPYYSSCPSETPNTLYSTVNKLKRDADSRHECVYYLAHNPDRVRSEPSLHKAPENILKCPRGLDSAALSHGS